MKIKIDYTPSHQRFTAIGLTFDRTSWGFEVYTNTDTNTGSWVADINFEDYLDRKTYLSETLEECLDIIQKWFDEYSKDWFEV